MSAGGQNTVTQNSQPPAAFLNAYQNVNNRAQGLAQQPYQPYPYPSQEVAPLSPEQNQGIATINNAQAGAQPFISQAQGDINRSTAPLLPGIQPYLNQAQGGFNQAQSALQSGQIKGAFTPYGNAATGEYGALTGALSGNTLQNTMSPYVGNASQGYNTAEGALSGNAITRIQSPYLNSASGGYQQAQGALGSQSFTGLFDPYAAAAGSTFGQGGQGIQFNQVGANQINQYESPYTQQVVGATQAEFNNQNQQQQQAVKGNAISNGAFGGDRSAVAAGITAGQEQLAQAPVIAGLENQGYAQALGEANTQQQTQLQQQIAQTQAGLTGAQGIAGLGATQLGALGQEYGLGLAGAQGQQSIGAQQASALGQEYGLNLAGAQGQAQLGQQQESALAQEYGLTGQAAQGTAALGAENAALVGQEYGLGVQGAQGNLGVGQAALGANEANAWLNSQAGYGLANLGNEQFGQTIGQGNAMLGAGGLQQQVNQQNMNTALSQWQASQAWPYQTTGWQAGIAEGLGGASGGSSSTTSPGPSGFSQAAGLGLTGLALNGMGAFNGLGSGLSSIGSGIGSLFGAGAGSSLTGLGIGDITAGGLLVKRGGGIPEGRAPGGGITSFPGHLARMPGTGPRGITANDNLHIPHPFMPRMKLAAGGANDDNFVAAENDPDAGGISGSDPMDLMPMPIPPIPPAHGGHGIAASHGGDGNSIPTPPMPPNGNQGAGITAGPPALPPTMDASAPGMAAQGAPPSQARSGSPWEALLAAGLGIMGGTSPHALTNIGRGGMQGLEFGEQQRVREENASLRQLQQQDLAAYRQGMLTNAGNRNDTYAQIAQTKSAAQQALAALEMARAAHTAASHASEGDILASAVNSLTNTTNPDTGQKWTQADALRHIRGIDSLEQHRQALTDQGTAHVQQGEERLDQGSQRLAQSRDAQAARDALVARGQDMNSVNADINNASRLVASGNFTSLDKALAAVQAGRATQAPQAASPAQPAPTAQGAQPPPDPLGIR